MYNPNLSEKTNQVRGEISMRCRFICSFGVLHRFQHCTGHIAMGSWKGRGNQYIQFVMVLYCKLLTNGKQLPAFPLEAMLRTEPRPQRWEARVLPLCHRGPSVCCIRQFRPSMKILVVKTCLLFKLNYLFQAYFHQIFFH